MANSSEKTPEKASFSHKCSLLSQYFKEKGSFGDLSLGMTCNVEPNGTEKQSPLATTMNLFPVDEKSDDALSGSTSQNTKSVDLFADSSVIKSTVSEPQTAKMTIFYAGKVIVFNDFSAHKAQEVMALAANGTSPSPLNNVTFSSNIVKNPVEPSSTAAIPSSSVVSNLGNNLVQDQPQPQPRGKSVVGDLPIARRASLHRFLEKRKDRINAKVPYQTNSGLSTPLKQDDSKKQDDSTFLALLTR
jgi:jasmonate ZIM domain-containing protein